MAARYAEFRRLAEEGRAERLAMGRLRRRATIARKGIVQILEVAAEYGFGGEKWQGLASDVAVLIPHSPDEVGILSALATIMV